MGIDVGGAFTISGTSGSQAFKIAGASDALTIDTTGRSFLPNQPGFLAGIATDPGWIAMANDGWTYQNWFNQTTYAKQGYASSRFTAPVAGHYLFIVSSYHYKPGGSAGHWMYNQIYINGTAPGPHHIIGYPHPAGYSWGAETSVILKLAAGDYADFYLYSSSSTNNIYRAHTQFSGYLVG